MDITKVRGVQAGREILGTPEDNLIDFDKLHSALRSVHLLNCRGSVVRVAGLRVESNGPAVGLGELCGIHMRDGRRVLAEVVGFQKDHLILLPLEHIEGISPGDAVTTRSTPRYITLSDEILGRVVNGLGEPIDGKGPLTGTDRKALDASSPAALSREKICEPLALGIRSMDGLLTCGKGQRLGIFAGSGVGKSVLLGDIANSSDASVNVVALIGERGREVREFLEGDLGAEGLARSVVVVASSDSPPIQRINFGRSERLPVRDGEPVIDLPLQILREVKFCAENGPRPEISKEDFALKAQVCDLLAQMEAMGSGVIRCLEVKHGLPFKMTIEDVTA